MRILAPHILAYQERWRMVDELYALRNFARLRGQRERQWQRLHPDPPCLWRLDDNQTFCFEPVSAIQLAYRHGHWNPSPTDRAFAMQRISRDRDQIARRRRG